MHDKCFQSEAESGDAAPLPCGQNQNKECLNTTPKLFSCVEVKLEKPVRVSCPNCNHQQEAYTSKWHLLAIEKQQRGAAKNGRAGRTGNNHEKKENVSRWDIHEGSQKAHRDKPQVQKINASWKEAKRKSQNLVVQRPFAPSEVKTIKARQGVILFCCPPDVHQ